VNVDDQSAVIVELAALLTAVPGSTQPTVVFGFTYDKEEYWLGRLESCGRSSTRIWKTMSPLLGRGRDVTGATGHTADGFAASFPRKIERVLSDTAANHRPGGVVVHLFSTVFAGRGT
jgi:hypothetical protein